MTTARLPASPVLAPIRQSSTADRYLLFLCLVLLGCAVDGRGFAYLFTGELAFVAGVAVLMNLRGWSQVLQMPQILLLIPFWLWGLARTIPFLGEYRVDAIRDAMLWGYSFFAFLVAALIASRPERLMELLRRYRKFSRIFLATIPLVVLLYRTMWAYLPRWPWAGVPVIEEKEGDILVHLAAIFAFWIAGVDSDVHPLWVILLTINVAVMGVIDRAGMLAFLAVGGLCAVCRPAHPLIRRLALVFAGVVLLLWAADIHIEVPGGKGREISFDQIVVNLRSMGSDTGSDGLDSTKEWRMNWWHEIIRYTIHGPYRWTGKGFGVNLADDDGHDSEFQVLRNDHSLRAPHSAHMDILAREGVPGLTIWILLQLSWAVGAISAYISARIRRDTRWQAVLLFLGAAWLAFLINSSFDVFLEGPMGGIWFWTIFGVGAAAMWLYRRRPEVLYRD